MGGRAERGEIEWRECMRRPGREVLVQMRMLGSSVTIRRTVRRPRLTVPTNLQAVIMVDMLCLSGAAAPMLSEVCVCREQWMVLLACMVVASTAQR